MFCFNKKNGFTLSEVLVTLGLIGIVSAITIPNLSFNYRGKVLEQQFLATYSDIKEAASRLNDKHGGDWATYVNGAGYGNWYSEFMAEFNGGNQYRVSEIAYANIKEPLKELYRTNSDTIVKRFNLSINWGPSTICDNGGIWLDSKGRVWTFNGENGLICVDVNGPAKPNRMNVDHFVFAPMSPRMVAIWVHNDPNNPSNYSGSIYPCNYEEMLDKGTYNTIPASTGWAKGSGSALDACPFYEPVINAWPMTSAGAYKPSARGRQPVNDTTYWKGYIEYK